MSIMAGVGEKLCLAWIVERSDLFAPPHFLHMLAKWAFSSIGCRGAGLIVLCSVRFELIFSDCARI